MLVLYSHQGIWGFSAAAAVFASGKPPDQQLKNRTFKQTLYFIKLIEMFLH